MTRYDILIATRPFRHKKLCTLLAELDRQMQPGVGVIVYRDNEVASYGIACQTLMEASEADYVSWLDDDDWLAEDYLELVTAALEDNPDYVGWPEDYSINGHPAGIIVHSLHDRSAEYPSPFAVSDIVHKNPIRRELAMLGKWSGQYGADRWWWTQVRNTGQVQTEVWINKPIYQYRFNTSDEGQTPYQLYEGTWPVIPSYSWLKEL